MTGGDEILQTKGERIVGVSNAAQTTRSRLKCAPSLPSARSRTQRWPLRMKLEHGHPYHPWSCCPCPCRRYPRHRSCSRLRLLYRWESIVWWASRLLVEVASSPQERGRAQQHLLHRPWPCSEAAGHHGQEACQEAATRGRSASQQLWRWTDQEASSMTHGR